MRAWQAALIEALYEVSDPRLPTHILLPLFCSPTCTHVWPALFRYGAHLSKEQVTELVVPHPDTLGFITSWLKHGSVSSSISMTHSGGWLTVTSVPVPQANDLLDASYQLYQHTGMNKTILFFFFFK
jgi:hypothetical protein